MTETTEHAQPQFPAPPTAPVASPIGQVRRTGMCVLLMIVTLGIYGFFWYYNTHEEMKRHSGQGLGGLVAVLIALFVGILSPFLASDEIGKLRASRGQEPRVSALTGLWSFPGSFILVGPFVWFIKTNNAINEYWISQGARP